MNTISIRDYIYEDPGVPMLPLSLPITAETLAEGAGVASDKSDVIRGFMDFPTDPPPEDILAGDAWLRIYDTNFLNSGAGMGKSVGTAHISMAWPLGLPYFGIAPARPLKIIHFCGEDDESTIGQCREGFLDNAEAITGRKLKSSDLQGLDSMVRTDFSREYTGLKFIERLETMLTEEHADVILINPLLSFIGGPIVEKVSEFLREWLGPLMKRHRCAALIAHHTCKLTKASWEEMDFTYSGIGGGDVANMPRSILTLAPTAVKGLNLLHVSKRTTTGWKDDDGKFTDHIYIQRTDNPKRPAWLPVSHSEAQEHLGSARQTKAGSRAPMVPSESVTQILSSGDKPRITLIDLLMVKHSCSDKTAKDAITKAQLERKVGEYKEAPESGGRKLLWYHLTSLDESATRKGKL